MKSHSRRKRLTHDTAADVGANFHPEDGHHRYGSGGREPVGFAIATGVITGCFVAGRERHGGENREAGARLACRMKKIKEMARETKKKGCSIQCKMIFQDDIFTLGLTQILCVSLLLSFQVNEAVAHPKLAAACRTHRHLN